MGGIGGSRSRHAVNPSMGALLPHPCGKRSGAATADTAFFRCIFMLNVEIGHRQCIFFDEFSPWLDVISHQGRENLIGRDRVFDSDL